MFKNHLHDMQKQAQMNYAVPEEILLDLHHHIARLSWLVQEYLFLVKSNQDQQSKFKVIADQLFYSYKIYLYQYVHICICILFALNQKRPTMLHEDVKRICKVICSLVC